MPSTQAGNWAIETTDTEGNGAITLSGPVDVQHVAFQAALLPGDIYYTILNGNNREAGIGAFNGTKILTRTTVLATLVNNVYNDTNPVAINLVGTSLVANTFNATSYRELFDHLSANNNPHNITAVQVPYDPTTDPTSNKTDVQAALVDHGDSIEERVPSMSGITSGGFITETSPTQYTIDAGQGIIYDNSTSPANTAPNPITWPLLPNNLINTTGLTAGRIYVFVTASSTVLAVTSTLAPSLYRDNIFLGAIFFTDGVISSIANSPAVIKQTATDLYDIIVQQVALSGSAAKPVTNELQVWTEEGSFFYPGANWYTDRKNPNNLAVPQAGDENTPISFNLMTQDSEITGPVTTMPVQFNPSGNTLGSMSGNNATIHRLYSNGASGRVFILLYGQIEYADAKVAKDNLQVDESLTIFPPEINGFSFIAWVCVEGNAPDFNDINDAWIVNNTRGGSSTAAAAADHTILANKDAIDQHPIESIGIAFGEQLRDTLDVKARWRGIWTSQQYIANEMVRDGNWLMIANKPTIDRAAPQDVGSPVFAIDHGITPGQQSDLSVVKVVHKYTITKQGYLQNLFVYIPDFTLDTVTQVVIDNITTGESSTVNNPIVSPNTWESILTGSMIVGVGDEVTVTLRSYNAESPDDIDGPWTSSIGSGSVASQVVQFDDDKLPSTVGVSYTDGLGADITTELQAVQVGAILIVTEVDDTNRNFQCEVSAIDIAQAGYITYTVIDPVSSRAIRDNRACMVTIDAPLAVPTEYAVLTDYWDTPPTFATVQSELFYGDVLQVDVNDAYGIDILFQEAVKSDDWDVMSLSGSSVGGGDSSGGSGIHIGDSPPTDKVATPIWLYTVTGKTFTWYEDINSGQWLQDVAISEGNKIGEASIDTTNIANLAVTEAKLANDAVTSSKIKDLTILNQDIANLAISGSKLASNTITATQIAAGAVTNSELGSNAVSTIKILNGNVSNAKLASNAVQNNTITDNAISGNKITSGTITGAKLANGTINSTQIQTQGIESNDYALSSIGNTTLVNGTVESGKLNILQIQQASYMPTAWAKFNAAGSVLSGFGISSVTKLGDGSYQIFFSPNMVNTNYMVQVTGQRENNSSNNFLVAMVHSQNTSTVVGSVRVNFQNVSGVNTAIENGHIMIFGGR